MTEQKRGGRVRRRRGRIIHIASSKGGVGKTHTTQAVAEIAELYNTQPLILSADTRSRLDDIFGAQVSTIVPPTIEEVRADPKSVARKMAQLFDAPLQTAKDGRLRLIDVGSSTLPYLLQGWKLTDFEEEVGEHGVPVHLWVVSTAELQSMEGAVTTLQAVRQIAPSVVPSIVLNGRDGPFAFYPNSPADKLWREQLQPSVEKFGAIRIPAIAPGSWSPFEAGRLRFLQVVAADVATIQAWTGLTRPEAKVVRGDIAAWVAAVHAPLAEALGLADEEVVDG